MNNRIHLLYFEWDGTSSEKYKLYITNSGSGISLPTVPAFDSNISTPMGQNFSYHMGTAFKNNSFTLNVVALQVTALEYQEIINWLDVRKVAVLRLDTKQNFFLYAKITNISSSLWHPYYDKTNNTYLLTFSITFTTIGDYAFQSDTTYTYNLDEPYYDLTKQELDPQYLQYTDTFYNLPVAVYDFAENNSNQTIEGDYTITTKTIKFINPTGFDYFLNGNIEGVSTFTLTRENEKFYDYNFRTFEDYNNYPDVSPNGEKPTWSPIDLSFKGQHGFVTDTATEELIETEVSKFFDEEIAYDLKYNTEYAKQLTSNDTFNAGSLNIPPSTLKTYPVSITLYSKTTDSVTKYYFNYTFAYTDAFVETALLDTNTYLRFFAAEGMTPIKMDEGLLIKSRDTITQEISRDKFLTLTEQGTVFSKSGNYIFIDYSTVVIKTSVFGTGVTREFYLPLLNPLHGFTRQNPSTHTDETKYDYLYYNEDIKQWVVDRQWKKFILDAAQLQKLRIDYTLIDLPMEQTNLPVVEDSLLASHVESIAFNYYYSQQFTNDEIIRIFKGLNRNYFIFSIPLENINPYGSNVNEMWLYSNRLESLKHHDISSTEKEGFYILKTPQGPRLVIRLNSNKVSVSPTGEVDKDSLLNLLSNNNLEFVYLTEQVYQEVIQPNTYQELLEYANKEDTIEGHTDIVSGTSSLIPTFDNPVEYLGVGYNGYYTLELQKSIVILNTKLRTV